MAKKPNIRFAGFEDDWEQRKLPEFVSFFNGLTYTPDDVRKTGTLVLRSSNVKNGEIIDADNVYVSEKVATSENVQVGDIIVVVRNGSRALIGKHAQIKAFMPNTVIGAFMSGIRSEHPSFVNALLDTSAFECEIAKNMGATINQITGYMFSKMEFTIPSEEEQKKIGDYFRNLDHIITLHQRKCDELKKVKKFMLQKMFPKKGEKNPEIRFDGFTNDWEQRKFSELYAKSSEKNDGSIGMDRNITVATMQFKEDVKVSTAEYLKTYYTFNLGDIAFEGHQSKEFRYGRFVENDIGNGIVSHIFAVFRPIKEFDLQFWKYAINNEMLMQRILSRSTKASTMMHDLVTEDFLNEIFLVPSLNEQKKIGTYLKSIDHLITLHQCKCKSCKKYYKCTRKLK